MQIKLNYGPAGFLTTTIPDNCLGAILTPSDLQPAASPEQLIEQALADPIGSPSFEALVKATDRIAFIVDDVTRVTPAHLILPPLLAKCHAQGVPVENITIIMALGTHRAMTQVEVEQKLGEAIATRYHVVNQTADDADAFAYLGVSSNGIPAYIKQAVAEADVRVGIGQIVPHMDAGFSGGAKIILPGVCSRQTVEAFHAQEVDLNQNLIGNIESPLRRDLEEFVASTVGLDFIVNIVPTRDEAIYQCVAGDMIAAHRAGVMHARAVYGLAATQRYHTVISNAFPKDIDLWQSTNAIWAGERLLEEGGTLIVVAEGRDGHSAYPNLPARIGSDPDELAAQFHAGQLEDRMTAIFGVGIGRFLRRFEIVLLSAQFSPEEKLRMGFHHFETIDDAVAFAWQRHPVENSIAILTHGGVSFPYLAE